MGSHNELQNFYEIINYKKENETKENNIVVINIINNIRYIWENNKDMWFSHEPLPLLPMLSTNYENSIGINMCIILHYDQIYRHPNKYIKENDKKYAYKFATYIALKMIHQQEYDDLKDWEKIFTLLTIRHNKNLKMKYLTLKKTYRLLEKEPNNSLYLRFLNATLWDIHKYKEENIGYKNEGYNMLKFENMYDLLKYYRQEKKDIKTIKNKNGINEILEKANTKENIINNNPKNYIRDLEKKIENELNDIIEVMERKELYKKDNYAVSISGGVDSMILSYIMNKVCKSKNKNLLLLHISYGNRECCDKEIELLQEWAYYLEVPLYIRRIDEIKRERSSSFRTLYEEITRKIRFSFYRYFSCPVLLGHNKDDCYENIFSNLSKRIHYDNLVGVKQISKESDIYILRPLMNIMKKEIYDYADYNDIPHLYDSTPEWSNRGKMRDILIPSINNFDKELLPGLYEYSKYTEFLEKQWNISFKEWIKKIKKNINIEIPKDEFFNSNYINLNFWIQLWFTLELETRPSNNSFKNVIIHIKRNKTQNNNRCILNSKFMIENKKDFISIKNRNTNKIK
jgi:tRNA(Ile)-lysidine synthetase-like protein